MNGEEALVCIEMYNALKKRKIWDLLSDVDYFGRCDRADFIAYASEEYLKFEDQERPEGCTWEILPKFVDKNEKRWEREILGEKKYYKVRAVIEVDVLDEDVDSAVREVRDCLNGMEMQLSNGWCPTKTLRVFSDDSDGSYKRE